MLGWQITLSYINILGKLYFFFNRKENYKIKKSVKDVFSDRKHSSEISSITKDVFRGIFSHYYEKFFNAYSNYKTLRNFVETQMEGEGLKAMENGLAKGKGILLITGHFGGVELIPAYLGSKNYPVTIVAKFKTKKLRDISIQQANDFSVKIIDANNTPNIMKAICQDLRDNRIVITQCDEIDEWKPCRKSRIFFLGKQINLDKTINILSKRCKASVVFGVMHRNDQNRYKFVATSLEEMERKYCRSVDTSIGEVVLKFMERYIYNHPEEWYQWKKYPALDMFTTPGIEMDKKPSIPILEPSYL
jgi:lauroyl/myristoyl acyltransferase